MGSIEQIVQKIVKFVILDRDNYIPRKAYVSIVLHRNDLLNYVEGDIDLSKLSLRRHQDQLNLGWFFSAMEVSILH